MSLSVNCLCVCKCLRSSLERNFVFWTFSLPSLTGRGGPLVARLRCFEPDCSLMSEIAKIFMHICNIYRLVNNMWIIVNSYEKNYNPQYFGKHYSILNKPFKEWDNTCPLLLADSDLTMSNMLLFRLVLVQMWLIPGANLPWHSVQILIGTGFSTFFGCMTRVTLPVLQRKHWHLSVECLVRTGGGTSDM